MTSKKSRSSSNRLLLGLLGLFIAVPVLKTYIAGDPISFIIPNALLFTPFRQVVKDMWPVYLKQKIDKRVRRPPIHIPEVQAADYSFETMRIATDDWRHPAVCRGFFNGTSALTKWPTPEYLPSQLGEFVVPVVGDATYGGIQNNRLLMKFKEGFADVVSNPKCKKYLFFPVNSRDNFNFSVAGKAQALREKIDQVVREDLDLDRIWPGFATKRHTTYFGAQFVIGRGAAESDGIVTGTGWHCAGGNNWFAQVVGRKRWYFADPEHSSYMHPLRGGKVNMMTGYRSMLEFHDHIPLKYADINAGDLLYNPDWEWHTIQNYEGLNIGIPIREVNVTLSLRNNFQYTVILLINKALEKVGLDIGGYPPSA